MSCHTAGRTMATGTIEVAGISDTTMIVTGISGMIRVVMGIVDVNLCS